VVPGPQATFAALGVTKSIPIVTVGFTDPVAAGVVVSLARPGGNLTGVTVADPQLWTGKRLEILTEAIPGLQRVAVLWDASVKESTQQMDAEAGKIGLRLHHLAIRSTAELEDAFKTARSGHAGAVMVMQTPLFTLNAPLVAEQGMKYRLAVMSLFSRMWRMVRLCPTARTSRSYSGTLRSSSQQGFASRISCRSRLQYINMFSRGASQYRPNLRRRRTSSVSFPPKR
jgi:ABC transporter substrate binding protein